VTCLKYKELVCLDGMYTYIHFNDKRKLPVQGFKHRAMKK